MTQAPLEGWGVATVTARRSRLTWPVTEALRLEGYAREVIRLIQDARKSAGLAVSDRIVVRWTATDAGVAVGIAAHGQGSRPRCSRCVRAW